MNILIIVLKTPQNADLTYIFCFTGSHILTPNQIFLPTTLLWSLSNVSLLLFVLAQPSLSGTPFSSSPHKQLSSFKRWLPSPNIPLVPFPFFSAAPCPESVKCPFFILPSPYLFILAFFIRNLNTGFLIFSSSQKLFVS